MVLIRLACSFLVLLLTTIFLMSNIEQLGKTSGLYLLLSSAAIGALLFILSGRWHIVKYANVSHFILFLFIGYFVINLIIDTQYAGEPSTVIEFTIGTTGGVVFAIGLGQFISFIISDIDLCAKRMNRLFPYVAYLILLYLAVVLFFLEQALQLNLSKMSRELFLIEDAGGAYQRAGDYMLVQFMICSALIVQLHIMFSKISKMAYLFAFLIFSLIAFCFMALAQLIGSNSGLVTVAIFYIFVLAFLYVSRSLGLREHPFKINLRTILLGQIARRLAFGIGMGGLCIAIAMFSVIEYFEIDLDMFRITGFGTGESNSVTSRQDFFINNFIEQFSFNPIFGNTQVDYLTTGAGTYAHSLLSVFSHLGLVGACIFCFLLVQIYIEITQKDRTSELLETHTAYRLFRIISISCVFLFGLLSGFFTWMPFWFAIGFFGIGMYRKKSINKHYYSGIYKCIKYDSCGKI